METTSAIGYIGFRAEHVLMSPKDRTDGFVIEGEIITRESLGAENIYQIDSIWGRFRKTFLTALETDDHIKALIPYDQLYYFDLEGQRIRDISRHVQREKILVAGGGV